MLIAKETPMWRRIKTGRLVMRARRPRIEALEARQLLATLLVNTADDENNHTNPTLSLREAIQVSNGTLAISALSPQEQAQISGPLSAPNVIDFQIPGPGAHTISVSPVLTQ